MNCKQENRRSSKRQPQKDLSKLHPVIVLDIYRDSRGKDIARYLPLSHDFNGNKNIRVGKSLDYEICGHGTDERSRIHIGKPRETELNTFDDRMLFDH